MWAEAFAKINLSLRVRSRRGDGLHELSSLMQSVSWSDGLGLEPAEEDSFKAVGAVPGDHTNLAWLALDVVRRVGMVEARAELKLGKGIPVAAGLGGGSADAAAVLRLGIELWGLDDDLALSLAPNLGSDVPFCVVGGSAMVGGAGELVDPIDPLTGFAIGVVVPPVELSTAAVYQAWDMLGGPSGPSIEETHLPPPLRSLAPLVNDLMPAATHVAPDVEHWRGELEHQWSRSVFLSGSGPSLFAYFVDEEEAANAMKALPPGARASRATVPVPVGSQSSRGTLPDRWGVV